MRNIIFGFGVPLLCLSLFTGTVLFFRHGLGEERIPFTFPTLPTQKMPPVFFTHDKHVEYMECVNAECTLCHRETEEGPSETFLDVKAQPEKNKSLSGRCLYAMPPEKRCGSASYGLQGLSRQGRRRANWKKQVTDLRYGCRRTYSGDRFRC